MIVLFDIDGTLLLSGGAGRDALARALDRHLPVSGAMDGISCAGKTDLVIVEEATRAAVGRLPGAALVRRILATYVELLPGELERSTNFRLMPGVPEVLHTLRRRRHTALAVATGNIEAGARAKLDRARLGALLPRGGYGDHRRDRVDILRAAIAVAGDGGPPASREVSAVVVGDTTRDVEAAHRLGLPAAVIADITTPRGTLEESAPELVMEDLRELLPWTRRLERRRGDAPPRGP